MKSLNISKRGWVILKMDEQNNGQEAEYVMSTDGRMCFKSGWWEFAGQFNLTVGSIVLILFSMGRNRYVNISFDIL
jgi:hypothetical protein